MRHIPLITTFASANAGMLITTFARQQAANAGMLMTIFAVSFLTAPTIALAHGDEVIDQKSVGNYILEFAYDKFEYDLGSPVPLSFNITNKDTQEEVPFTHVWVRITKDDEFNIVLSTSVRKADIGTTTITYGFPGNGSYNIWTSFRGGEETLAEETFPMEVTTIKSGLTEETTATPLNPQSLLFLVGGLVLGSGLTTLLRKKKH